MAGALVAGGVVGAAFGEGFTILHEIVKHVVGQIIMYISILKSLESTLDGIALVVQEIRRLSLALDLPNKEKKRLIEQMKKGSGSQVLQNQALETLTKVNQNTTIVLETAAKVVLVLEPNSATSYYQ